MLDIIWYKSTFFFYKETVFFLLLFHEPRPPYVICIMSDRKMLLHHEVLMALAGFPGSVFMLSKDTGQLEVRPPRPTSSH